VLLRTRLTAALTVTLAFACERSPAHTSEPSPTPLAAAPAAVDRAERTVDPPASPRRTLKLLPLGTFPAHHLPPLAASLERTWGLTVAQLPPTVLPQAAYYPPRKRYRADRLNAHLESLLGENAEGAFILGLTQVDVSSTKGSHRDWGVIGLAYVGGPSGVLSLRRIVPSARDPEHVQKRLEIVAAHEVGHLLGLPHCEEPGCIMREAEGTLVHVDESDGGLGPECRARLRAL
jgi:archaemetzincin